MRMMIYILELSILFTKHSFAVKQSSLPGVSGGHAEPRGSQWLGQLLGQ